ncbi:MAG TPA: late competence development ComFB family protein [Rectinemataceae bacterium]|nr:late competence development ComFB family protein [Rectinemataceae bacterium]
MGIRDDYDFSILTNEAERMVTDELERQLAARQAEQICVCEDCVIDMAALALNSIRPVYRVSLLGTMYAHALDGGDFAEEVRRGVSSAIDRVHANPSHD